MTGSGWRSYLPPEGGAVATEYDPALTAPAAPTATPRSTLRPLWRHAFVRKLAILVAIALVWEALARWQDNDLLFPTFLATARAFVEGVQTGELLSRAGISLRILAQGYVLGVLAAFVLTVIATSSQIGRDILTTLTSMFNPLPAIALLPLALLWFGLGAGSLLFVLVHSVLWPLSLATFAGFEAVPQTLRMAGRNYGLRGLRYVVHILVPAALPSIVSGLKIAWAFAWRTLIAAELVFGVASGRGGLGWYVFQARNELYTDRVFAGLALVIVIGLLMDSIVFAALERITIRRWGVARQN